MPKFQVFPSLESPDDHRKGKQAVLLPTTLPPTAPASAPDPTVLEKAKGHFDRRELVTVQKESDKKPLTWPEHNLLQVNDHIIKLVFCGELVDKSRSLSNDVDNGFHDTNKMLWLC